MYIDAIMWYFGLDKQQAAQYYVNCIYSNEQSSLDEILRAYQNQPHLSFYNNQH